MTLWAVVGASCNDCDTLCVGVFDHEPTREDHEAVADAGGGMRCVRTRATVVEVNMPVTATEEEPR